MGVPFRTRHEVCVGRWFSESWDEGRYKRPKSEQVREANAWDRLEEAEKAEEAEEASSYLELEPGG